jgi:hypothetical protein
MQFNRERFLFYLLASVMAVNALFFAFGLFSCSKANNPKEQCPKLGERFDNYSEKALAAVLGLIAGAGAFTLTRRQSGGGDHDAVASPLPQRQTGPLPGPSVSPVPQRGRGERGQQAPPNS